MLISSHPQGLTYFRQSSLFYYTLMDLHGCFIYANPVFQKAVNNGSRDLYGSLAADTFIPAEANIYKAIIKQCLQNPGIPVFADLKVKRQQGTSPLIRWEFSACVNDEGNPESIQAIGVATLELINEYNELGDLPVNERSEKTCRDSEKRFNIQAFILNNVTDVIVTTDVNRKVTSWNKVAEKLSGISEEEAVGKITHDIIDTNYFPYTHDQVAGIVLKESIWRGEISFTGCDGEKKYLLHTVSQLYNDEGQYIGLLGVGKDITERKKTENKLRESEKQFRDFIYNLNQGIIIQSNRGELIVCNHAAQNILGFPEADLIGITSNDPRWDGIHEDGSAFPGDTHPAPMAFKTKKPVRNVIIGVIKQSTSERIWLLVNADPTLDNEGTVLHVVVSFTDITEQRRLSQQLIDQEIQKQKQLTQAMIDGQEKERQEIGKELHDNINQHLTTTRLYLEVAKEKASGDVLEMINLSHKNLAAIINEIRSLSQALVPPTLGDLGLIESVQDLCDSLKRAHTFHIEFLYQHFHEEDLPGNMKLMIFRIIQEQVSNIIRHAFANAIQIRLQSDAEYIILTIADDGKGFDPVSNKKGVGFTNIVNRVGLFNGKVEIVTEPGNGCVVSVIIPVATS